MQIYNHINEHDGPSPLKQLHLVNIYERGVPDMNAQTNDSNIIVSNSDYNFSLSLSRFTQIYDGADSSAPLIGEYCGSSNPGIIVSSGNSLYMKFTSDGSVTYPGFTGAFQMGEAPELPTVGGKSNLVLFAFS